VIGEHGCGIEAPNTGFDSALFAAWTLATGLAIAVWEPHRLARCAEQEPWLVPATPSPAGRDSQLTGIRITGIHLHLPPPAHNSATRKVIRSTRSRAMPLSVVSFRMQGASSDRSLTTRRADVNMEEGIPAGPFAAVLVCISPPCWAPATQCRSCRTICISTSIKRQRRHTALRR